jgi:HAD superfamily hydrolase (TIGR01490 family)
MAARPASDGAGPAAGPGAVFFDLDRTLMEGSSAFQFGRAAHRAGLLSHRQLIADGMANLRFRLFGASDERSQALRARVSSSLAGVRILDMRRLGADVLAGILPRVYPGMLALAYEHQDAGRRVYIVTAAARELAEVLAQVLALDGGIGSRFSLARDGVFTGEPGEFIYGAEKAAAIRRLAEREGFELAACYAYTDSVSDLPMLELVGHPVAVNPDGELARIARERGWEVLRFERLGRRLKAAAALAGAAAAGGIGSAAVAAGARRRVQRRRPRARLLRPRAAGARRAGAR